MKYGCIDDCKSNLGKRLMQWRAERPSEWLMDEFILGAEEQNDEIARLRDEVERVKCAHSDMAEMYRKAIAEVEALRVDAERYRWLRENALSSFDTVLDGGRAALVHAVRWSADWREELDAAIDAARGKDND